MFSWGIWTSHLKHLFPDLENLEKTIFPWWQNPDFNLFIKKKEIFQIQTMQSVICWIFERKWLLQMVRSLYKNNTGRCTSIVCTKLTTWTQWTVFLWSIHLCKKICIYYCMLSVTGLMDSTKVNQKLCPICLLHFFDIPINFMLSCPNGA